MLPPHPFITSPLSPRHPPPDEWPRPGTFLKGYSVLQAPPTIGCSSNSSTCSHGAPRRAMQGHVFADALCIIVASGTVLLLVLIAAVLCNAAVPAQPCMPMHAGPWCSCCLLYCARTVGVAAALRTVLLLHGCTALLLLGLVFQAH